MREQWCGGRDGFWKRQLLWAGAGVLFLATLLLGTSWSVINSCPATVSNQFLVASNDFAGTHHGMPWYIRSGQWRADIRSLGALLQYLTDSEEVAQTNAAPVRADNA